MRATRPKVVVIAFSWIKRPDLITVPHDAGGWIVKDPLTLQYALLDEKEYTILNLLDGRYGFAELLAAVRRKFPSADIAAQDLAEFIRSLAGHQLIRQVTGRDSVRLSAASGGFGATALNRVFGILRIQFRLLNPSSLISRIMPVAQIFFTRTAALVFAAVFCSALALVILRFGQLVRDLPSVQEFLGLQNLAILMLVFVSVKILHEAGHAVTARYFGAECSECGVMLMVFTPVLYTNVSDSWLLPRRQRMLVTAAGILTELFIASVCTLLWWNAQPGFTKSLLLNTMVICSVNTLLFNGNPLLRFDGYFLLADRVGIPNLSSRASASVRDLLIRLLTGRRPAESGDERHRYFPVVYGILAGAYRLVLTVAILKLIGEMTAQWRIQAAGTVLSAIVLIGFLVLPTASFVSRLADVIRQDPAAGSRLRIVVCLLVPAALLFVPLPRTVVAPAFVRPTSQPVYARLPGQLSIQKRYGQEVTAGDTLAVLKNPELEQTRSRLQGRVDQLQIRLDALLDNPSSASADLIPPARKSLQAAQQRLAEFEKETAALTVTAESAGIFLPPPSVERLSRKDLPQHWFGTAAGRINDGAWIERGTLLGYVGDADNVRLLICMAEDDVESVERGQSFRFLSRSADVDRSGTVESVAGTESRLLPYQLAVSGLISGKTDGRFVEPPEVIFSVTGTLSGGQTNAPPALYSTGHAAVDVAWSTVFDRLVRYYRRTF